MVLKKQTVWLLSMLTIMVVLSAYYLVQGPVEQVPVVTDDREGDESGLTLETSEVTGEQVETEASENTAVIPQGGSDYFVAYRMNRDALQSKQMEEWMTVMSDSKASSEEITDAKQKYEQLATMKDAEHTVEELIKANGYNDAIVVAKDDRVDVIVQAEELNESQAVEIINLVKRHIDVPANNVVVSYK